MRARALNVGMALMFACGPQTGSEGASRNGPIELSPWCWWVCVELGKGREGGGTGWPWTCLPVRGRGLRVSGQHTAALGRIVAVLLVFQELQLKNS